MLQGNLGTQFGICGISKPNSPLQNVIAALGKLDKDITKQDHIIVGGKETIIFQLKMI
jgi:hypothetical protein